jgi:hypothetical protein
MKIKLMGRASQVVYRGTTAVFVFESQKVPALPEGLPEWPEHPITYTVYMATKQWRKVMGERSVSDLIIIEGYGFYDPELKAISVLATNLKLKPPDRPRPPARPTYTPRMRYL